MKSFHCYQFQCCRNLSTSKTYSITSSTIEEVTCTSMTYRMLILTKECGSNLDLLANKLICIFRCIGFALNKSFIPRKKYATFPNFFFADLFAVSMIYYVERYGTNGNSSVPAPAWKAVLHGDEDITVTLPEGFWADMGIISFSLNQTDGFSWLGLNEGSPCEFTAIK